MQNSFRCILLARVVCERRRVVLVPFYLSFYISPFLIISLSVAGAEPAGSRRCRGRNVRRHPEAGQRKIWSFSTVSSTVSLTTTFPLRCFGEPATMQSTRRRRVLGRGTRFRSTWSEDAPEKRTRGESGAGEGTVPCGRTKILYDGP